MSFNINGDICVEFEDGDVLAYNPQKLKDQAVMLATCYPHVEDNNNLELINELNKTEAERVRWMTAALTSRNEIDRLKQQIEDLNKLLSNAVKNCF